MRDIVVIPTYNERESVGGLIAEVFRVAPGIHVLVVDDSSPDGTADVVRALQQEFPNLTLRVRAKKTGLGSAYLETFRILLQDPDVATVTTMDADWSHNPSYLPELLRQSRSYDVVIGSRYVRGGGAPKWEPWRRFLSWGGNVYARIITGVAVHDLTAGFVTFRRAILAKFDFSKIHSTGYAYTIESKCAAHLAGARIKEIPIIFEERRGGESKISGHIVREGLLAPLRVRFWRFFG